MHRKDLLIRSLMATSIALLVVLQFLWLRSSYLEAGSTFRRETSLLFKNTLFAMHDSLIERSITPLAGDSAFQLIERRHFTLDKPPHLQSKHGDSLVDVSGESSQVQIFISSSSDSVGKALPRIMRRFKDEGLPKRFIMRMGHDSLRVDSIRKAFSKTLDDAGIDARFDIVAVATRPYHDAPKPDKGAYVSEVIRINPFNEFAVSFASIQPLLFQKIMPQILFSAFLTLLTIASFIIMYRSLRSQQKLMELKNDFINNVTHELKTPVATVSVALEALKNFNALNNPQRTAEYLEIAQNELNRLTLMTDKILKTSVFETQGVDLKLDDVDLAHVTETVLSSMKLVFEKKKITATFNKEGNDFRIRAAQEHLTNVLYNLIDNAIKYSGEHARIDVLLRETPEHITLSVKDNGIGIPKEFQDKVFEKFFRVPSGDVHNTKGYGLGLSYVASVVRSHGGTIAVESEPGKGSSFVVILPRGQ